MNILRVGTLFNEKQSTVMITYCSPRRIKFKKMFLKTKRKQTLWLQGYTYGENGAQR